MSANSNAISALDIFKIGIGPSSSHTVGPMRAAASFVHLLDEQPAELFNRINRIRIQLYGSLASTGIGHGTDVAIVMGLMGEEPQTIDPNIVAPTADLVKLDGELQLARRRSVPFVWTRDISFEPIALPYHPNGMRITAFDNDECLLRETYYSIGGGFVVSEAQVQAESSGATHTADDAKPLRLQWPFETSKELMEICAREHLSVSAVMRTNERAWRSDEETHEALRNIWLCMDNCIARGLRQQGELPGGLHVLRRAMTMKNELLRRQNQDGSSNQLMNGLEWVNLFALAVSEENAGGGRVVTAPTNGAAGIIPAVLKYYLMTHPQAGDNTIERYLLTTAAIGILIKKRASIAGSEVGCQGETGSACSMAAAGLAELLGGNPYQVENAAEIGLEHSLGLTCDPIGGLVQIPCIERNAMGSLKAINAAQIAMLGNGTHKIGLDNVIKTMRDTGYDMMDKYKETSRGGLAVNYTQC